MMNWNKLVIIIGFCFFVFSQGFSGESDIVINELMYHPVDDQAEDEYIELYNRGNEAVDLSNWSFTKGVRFTIPVGIQIEPDGYIVIGKNADRIREKYKITKVIGDYSGELSDQGETIEISNRDGKVIDSVTYRDSFPWPIAADEFGPSLECINPEYDNSLANNWTASQGNIGWTYVATEGIASSTQLLFYLPEAGELLLDDVALFDLDSLPLETEIQPMEYRHVPGGNDIRPMHFSQITLPLDSTRTLQSLRLPQEARIKVFGITLQKDQEFIPVSLSGFFNLDGISSSNNTNDGSLDGGGATYAAELLPADGTMRSLQSNPPVWWNLGSYRDGENNAVSATGQSIPVPAGMYDAIYLLATAVNAQTIYSSLALIYADGEQKPAIQVTDWAVSIPIATGSNIVSNGDFENGYTGWRMTGTHSGSLLKKGAGRNSSQALRIIASGPGEGPDNALVQDILSFIPGHRCRLNFWVYGDQGSAAIIAETRGGGLRILTQLGTQGSPGKKNTVWQPSLPPFFEEIRHEPGKPTSKDAVAVLARITGSQKLSQVLLTTIINGATQTQPMLDDGEHQDGSKGDGIYGIILPPQVSQTVVLYSLQAEDEQHRITQSPANEPTQHYGYFVYDGEIPTQLPIYFLYLSTADLNKLNRNPDSDQMVNGVAVIDQEVFDQIHLRYRGAWARSWPKKNWKIRLNKGHYYQNQRTLNLNSNYHDRAYMREKLSYDLFADSLNPGCRARFVWLQVNGAARGVYTEVEQPDERFLERIDRAGGSLYKSNGDYSALRSENSYRQTYEKETNEEEPYTALMQMCQQVNTIPDADVYAFFIQNFNLESYIDYLVVNACISNWDHLQKNHFVFQDTAGTGKWEFFPWDLDRTWGEFADWGVYEFQHILTGVKEHPGPTLGSNWWNRVQNRFLHNEVFLKMFYNRMREFLQTKFTEENLFPRIDALDVLIRDLIPWDKKITAPQSNWDYAQEVQVLKWYVGARRQFLFESLPVSVGDWSVYE